LIFGYKYKQTKKQAVYELDYTEGKTREISGFFFFVRSMIMMNVPFSAWICKQIIDWTATTLAILKTAHLLNEKLDIKRLYRSHCIMH
jgi:hypothetical protein